MTNELDHQRCTHVRYTSNENRESKYSRHVDTSWAHCAVCTAIYDLSIWWTVHNFSKAIVRDFFLFANFVDIDLWLYQMNRLENAIKILYLSFYAKKYCKRYSSLKFAKTCVRSVQTLKKSHFSNFLEKEPLCTNERYRILIACSRRFWCTIQLPGFSETLRNHFPEQLRKIVHGP